MRNTGYLDVFDETYYEFERDAFYMRNIKYTFLHAPIHKGQYFIVIDKYHTHRIMMIKFELE